MKRTAVLLTFLLIIPLHSAAEEYVLKLRASHHPGFLRIVVEGDGSLINKSFVYQRGDNVLLSFSETGFTILPENQTLEYSKINEDTIMFSPGSFSGLKVFNLKYPDRLVIDVYVREKTTDIPSVSRPKSRKEINLSRKLTVVIDPGHGGYENGIVKEAYKEKNIVLDISKKLGALVNSGSSISYLTRSSDRFMTLGERMKFANSSDADVFLSIHIGNHEGIIIYTPLITEDIPSDLRPYMNSRAGTGGNETLALLNAVEDAVVSSFGRDMVTIRPVPYSIISGVQGAALMIEFPSFEDASYSEDFNEEIADTLYKALYLYEEQKG